MRVGFIGIGNMGSLMAGNLVKKGFDVAIFDVNPERMTRFAQEYGCRVAGKLLDLAVNDVIVTMLPTGHIVRQVLLEGAEGGLAGALKPGTIVIDMSSSEPLGTQELGTELAKRQLVLIDAPVSGGVQRAQTGKLTIMIGANDAAAVERVKPVLLGMGERLFETGPLGCGHAMKALNNYVAAACFAATAEAILIGERLGLDPATMVDIMNLSTGRNFMTEMGMKDQVLNQRFASGFSVGLLAKDVKIAADLGEGVGLDAPLSRLVADRWAAARDRLGPSRDHMEAFLIWKQNLKSPPRTAAQP
jgi:3-hydroxyisobutyrate dehydrogenase